MLMDCYGLFKAKLGVLSDGRWVFLNSIYKPSQFIQKSPDLYFFLIFN